MTRVHLRVHGRVQGVWFRASAQREALALSLTGWVRNRRDGSVEAVVEGPSESVEAFVSWCQTGPPQAQVSSVDAQHLAPAGGLQGFVVRDSA